MFKTKFGLLVTICFMLVMIGCTKVNPAEEIYVHLEKAVSLEMAFEQQQEPLLKAENDEFQLYEQLLGLSDVNEIKKLAIEAIQLAETRKNLIEIEKNSLVEGYNEFSLILPIIEQFENVELKEVANELITKMDQRSTVYEKLYEEYSNAIKLDLQLYELVQKEDLTIDELETHHDLVNSSYEKVNELKDQFNETTIQYNDLKKTFYEKAQLKVVYN